MLKFTIKTPERGQYFIPFSSASIVDFEQVNICWKSVIPSEIFPKDSRKWFLKLAPLEH